MMSKVNQLKNKARREEQRENWSKAIELYTQALDASRKEGEAFADLSLYNRIGDIYLRIGQKNTAVRYYEQAIERYADQDLHTSAIALCNKVLRIHPERSTIFLQLGRLHLATNLIADARAHYHKYAEGMRERGSEPAAFDALEEFIEDTGDPQTVTLWVTWLAKLSDSAEAIERIDEIRSSLIAHGIGPESVIEQVRTGVIEGVEAGPTVDAEPDPLAGAFLSTPAPVGSDASDEPEVPDDVGEAVERVEVSDSGLPDIAIAGVADDVSVPEPDVESVEARDPEPVALEDTEPQAPLSVADNEFSAADEVAVPEPTPLELGSIQWDDEAEELLAELNQAVEEAWVACEPESHDNPAPVPSRTRPETDLERDERPAVHGVEESATAESPEGSDRPGTPDMDRPWRDSPDLTELEPSVTAEVADEDLSPPATDPAEDSAANYVDAVLGADKVDEWEPLEVADMLPSNDAFAPRDLSFEDAEFDGPVEWPATDPIGFAAEPSMTEDEIPEPEAVEPPEPDTIAAESGAGPVRDLMAHDACEEPEPTRWEIPIDFVEASSNAEGAEPADPAEETWETDAREAVEAALETAAQPAPEPVVEAVPDPDPALEIAGSVEDLVIDPGVEEVVLEPVAEFVAEPNEEAVEEAVPEPVVGDLVAEPVDDPTPVLEVSDTPDIVVENPETVSDPEPLVAESADAPAELSVEPLEDPAPSLEIMSEADIIIEEVSETVEVVGADLEPALTFLDSLEDEISVEPEPAPDPEGDVEVAASSTEDEELPVVHNPLAPPALSTGDPSFEAADFETITVEVPSTVEPAVPAPEADLAPAASHIAGSADGASSYKGIDDMKTPLAESRLTVEEDPEDAFRDWVQSASQGVLKRALPELENRSETDKALLVIQRLAHLEESSVEFKTRFADYLEKLGRTAPAADACLVLGAAHETRGRPEDARAAYERVLRIRPGDEDAKRALATLGDAPVIIEEEGADVAPTPYQPDHVGGTDSSGLLDMPIRPAAPTNGHANGHGNGDAVPRPYSGVAGGAEASDDFEKLLSEFRAELHHQPGQTGSSSRTELGASLKEMGRLDDAIRELQAAVNEPSPPPLAYELLGEAFLEKGQGRIAVRLLEKALGTLGHTDRELMGVLYQLGGAYEAVSESNKALICYERIFSVDIDYRDIQERIMACSA
jgi:tetratricopeptide (TPR) repeat protein